MDFDEEFKKIIARLEAEDEAESPTVSLWDINHTVAHLTEASLYLTNFISRYIDDDDTEFPDPLITLLPQVRELCNEISDVLSEDEEDSCDCDQCELEAEEEDEDDQR